MAEARSAEQLERDTRAAVLARKEARLAQRREDANKRTARVLAKQTALATELLRRLADGTLLEEGFADATANGWQDLKIAVAEEEGLARYDRELRGVYSAVLEERLGANACSVRDAIHAQLSRDDFVVYGNETECSYWIGVAWGRGSSWPGLRACLCCLCT